jgi:hypothetical protein
MGSSILHVPRVRPSTHAVARPSRVVSTEMLLQKTFQEQAASARRTGAAPLPPLQAHAFLRLVVAAPPVDVAPAGAPCRFGARCALCVRGADDAEPAQITWATALLGEFAPACHFFEILLRDAALADAARAGPWPLAAPADVQAHIVFYTLVARTLACALLLAGDGAKPAPGASQRITAKLQLLGDAHVALYEECSARAAAHAAYSDAALLEIVRPAAFGGENAAANGGDNAFGGEHANGGGGENAWPSRRCGRAGAVIDVLAPRAAPHYEAEDLRHVAPPAVERRVRETPLDALRAHYADAAALAATDATTRALLRAFGRAVLQPLAATEAWLGGAEGEAETWRGAEAACPARACRRADVGALIERVLGAASPAAFPPAFWQRFAARFWLDARFDTLTAVLLRVAVSEVAHGEAPLALRDARFAWRRFRNSHLDVVAFLCAQPYAALHARTRGCTPRALLDPLRGERALHEGDAPRLGQSYEFVNFFADCGLSDLPFNHMKFKIAPRCCGCREFDKMHDRKCVENTGYYYLTLLEIELALCGAYRHALAAPPFWQTLRVVALLRRRDDATAKQQLLQFQIDHPQLANACGAEAMVRAIATTPHHRALLVRTYPAWREFERAACFNMDVVRRVYGASGSVAGALAAAFSGPAALQAQGVYRHQARDYISFVCKLFRDEDRRRYVEGRFFDAAHSLSEEQAFCIDRYVAALVPNEVVDLTVLRDYFGMRENGLRVHDRLQRLYLRNRHADEIRAELAKFFIDEYILSAYFFERVQQHNNVRVCAIASVEVREAQTRRVREMCGLAPVRTGAELARALPPAVGMFVVAPCCASIKTPIAACMDSHAHGTIKVAFDAELDAFVCMRKETRGRGRVRAGAAEARRIANDMAHGGGGEDAGARLSAAQQSERHSLPCHETPCAIVPGLGNLIEPRGYHAKRKKKNRKSVRPSTIPLVHAPPYWITPCCGTWNSYRMECFGANGYVCGACRVAQRIETRLQLDVCIGCGARPALGEHFARVLLFDDTYQHTYARYHACERCTAPLVEAQPVALSQLRAGRDALALLSTALDALSPNA